LVEYWTNITVLLGFQNCNRLTTRCSRGS